MGTHISPEQLGGESSFRPHNISSLQRSAAARYAGIIDAYNAVELEFDVQALQYDQVLSAYPDTLAGHCQREPLKQWVRLGEAIVWTAGRYIAFAPFRGIRRLQIASVGLTPEQALELAAPQSPETSA